MPKKGAKLDQDLDMWLDWFLGEMFGWPSAPTDNADETVTEWNEESVGNNIMDNDFMPMSFDSEEQSQEATEEEAKEDVAADEAVAEEWASETTEETTTEEVVTEEAPTEKTTVDTPEDTKSAVDEVLKMIDDLNTAINTSDETSEQIKDKVADLQDTTEKMESAESVDEYKAVIDEYSKKFDELTDLLITKEADSEWIKNENVKLRKMVDSLSTKLDDIDFNNLKNQSLINVLDDESNADLRGLVKLYWSYKSGNEKVKDSLTESIDWIVKSIYGIDIKSIIQEKAENEKNQMSRGEEMDDIDSDPIKIQFDSKANEDFLPWLNF